MSKAKTISDQVVDLVIADLGIDDTTVNTDALDIDDTDIGDQVASIVEDQMALEAAESVSGKYSPMTFQKGSAVSANSIPGQSMFDALTFLNADGKDVRHDLETFAADTSNNPDLRKKAKLLSNSSTKIVDNDVGIQTFTVLNDILIDSKRTNNKSLHDSTIASLKNFAEADQFSPRLRAKAAKLVEQQSDPDALADQVADSVCEALEISDDPDDNATDTDEDPIFN